MSISDLARYLSYGEPFDDRWRIVVEFLKEYAHETAADRARLLAEGPMTTGDERWDALLAGLSEHLATRDRIPVPGWVVGRTLHAFWFPFNTPGARTEALVHAPAALRKRGVFVADYEVDAA